MNIYEKLAAVQQELKAPKDKKNTYAGYNYRNAEGILEAAKPVLAKHNATIILSDDVCEIGGRVYVEATAQFVDVEEKGAQALIATAYAREAAEKKGLDVSQVTGTASSYARKYALNGLLLIDDTKDPDTDEYAKQTQQAATEAQIKTIKAMAEKAGLEISAITKKPLEEFTVEQATELILALKKRLDE